MGACWMYSQRWGSQFTNVPFSFLPFSLPLSRFPLPPKLKILVDNFLSHSQGLHLPICTPHVALPWLRPLSSCPVHVLPGWGTLSMQWEDPEASGGWRGVVRDASNSVGHCWLQHPCYQV